PVGEDLAHDEGRALGQPQLGAEAPLEGPVVGHVELAVVEGDDAGGGAGVGVGAVHDLEGQVGGGAAPTGDDVRRPLGEVGVEVDRVGVVQALARVLVRGVDQHGVGQ